MNSVTNVARPRALKVATVVLMSALVVAGGVATPGVGAARSGSTAAGKAPATTVAASPLLARRNACKKSRLDVPACGVLWGIYTPPGAPSVGAYEKSIGRRFDIVKNYVGFTPGATFPNPSTARLAKGGRILDFSWTALNFKTRAKISFASIASGAWDKSVILPEARVLKSFHHKVILDFNHEFDSRAQAGKGKPAQYVAAYRHIHNVMRAAGVHNVIWAWLSTGDIDHAAEIRASYPGAAYVNWVGYDPYNFGQCHADPWRTPYQTFAPFYHWLRTQRGMSHKPIILGEYGSAAGQHVGSWYARVAATLRHLPRIKAVMQWSDATSPACDFKLTDSSAALAGFKVSSNARYVTGARR